MSIPHKLQNTFWMLETAAFIEWKDATPERKEEITKHLGELEGRMIVEEISKQVEEEYPSKNK